jgi:hypothetical protein
MILSSSYLAAMLLAGSKVNLGVSPLNPAIGIVYNILYCMSE